MKHESRAFWEGKTRAVATWLPHWCDAIDEHRAKRNAAAGLEVAMIFLWLNKRAWKHPGPIVNMAVRNAHSRATIGHETHLCVSAGETETGARDDLEKFYGVTPEPALHVHRIARWKLGASNQSLRVFL